jgi:hypothetical protein
MAWMIWIGAGMTMCGVLLLGWCVIVALRAKREGLEGAAMQERLKGLVALNLGAVALSAIGLMAVIAGIFLS